MPSRGKASKDNLHMGRAPLAQAMDAQADLRLLREMADAVARVCRETPFETFGEELRVGADGTATKLVDDLAEQEILRLLREREAGLDLLSEEAGYVDLRGDRLLVADPIDGTTNAVRGLPFYCVSLAIGRKTLGDVEVGLVQNLCTGDRYEAVRGQGATLNGRPIRVSPERQDLVLSMGFVRGIDSPLPTRGTMRSLGASALEMSLVASGALDGYQHHKPVLRIIDVAAATLLVREAGGVVLDQAGRDLDLPLSLAPRFTLTAAASRTVASVMGVGA